MAIPTKEELGFDPDALRDKYRVERDKRLREDANDQYNAVSYTHLTLPTTPYV